MNAPYKAIVSSDWNECLAPCGPYDCLAFNHPEIASELVAIFRLYTGNRISLGEAAGRIKTLLPGRLSPEEMDAYLDASFATYRGVPALIRWCLDREILFMINTTGTVGYFQRIFAKGLLPAVPVLSAHPMIRYPGLESDPPEVYELLETRDKAAHTRAVARKLGIQADKILLMGDSGGDGPHFNWGAEIGAFLIGSMTKASLNSYCRKKSITINLRFGLDYSKDQKLDPQRAMDIDFMDLASTIANIANK